MIQPAVLSLTVPTPGRATPATPSPVGSGALFALPEVAAAGAVPVTAVEAAPITDAVLLAGAGDPPPPDLATTELKNVDPGTTTPNGPERQTDAAPGNALPPDPFADVRPVPRRVQAPPSILVVPDKVRGRAPVDLAADGLLPDLPIGSDDRSNTSEDPVDDASPASTALPDAASTVDRSITNDIGDRMPPPVSTAPLADQPLPRPSTKRDTSPLPIVSRAAPLRSPATVGTDLVPSATPLDPTASTLPPGAADPVPSSRPRGSSNRPEAPPAISVLTIGAPVAAVEPAPDILVAMPTARSRSASPPSVATPRASDVASPAPTPLSTATVTTATVTTTPVLAAQTVTAVPTRATPAAARGSRASLAAEVRGAVAAAIPATAPAVRADTVARIASPLGSPASAGALPLNWQRAYVGGAPTPGDMPVTIANEPAVALSAASPLTVAPAIVPGSMATPLTEVIVAAAPLPRAAEPLASLPSAPPQVVVTPLPSAAPAAIVFGAARFAAQVAEDRDEPALSIATPLAAPAVLDRAVAATAQAPLDVTREHWPHAMIERIEMIRDAADAADTRIRLVPDALGAIDVEVRRDGDALDVRFRADQPQTRALLADAAPRLAEAAEARGLRLGQTSVGGDSGSQNQQPRQPLPATPPRAPRSSVDDLSMADDDTRLA